MRIYIAIWIFIEMHGAFT